MCRSLRRTRRAFHVLAPGTHLHCRRPLSMCQLPHHDSILCLLEPFLTWTRCHMQRLPCATPELYQEIRFQGHGRNEARGIFRDALRKADHHGRRCQRTGHHGQLHTMPRQTEPGNGEYRTHRLQHGKEWRRKSLLGLSSQRAARRHELAHVHSRSRVASSTTAQSDSRMAQEK